MTGVKKATAWGESGFPARLLGGNRLDGCQPANLYAQDHVDVSPLGRAPNPPLAQTSAATDKDALLAIFNATDGPSWDDSGTWAGRAPIGEWLGVTTDEDGRVVQLIVNLGGAEIPPEVGHLTGLTTLALGGVIRVRETLPELQSLLYLGKLDLSNNRLCGKLPPELGGLANLTGLYLGGNQLTGEIPPELGSLAFILKDLSLDGNRLGGCISDFLRDGIGYVGDIPVCAPEDHPGTPMR